MFLTTKGSQPDEPEKSFGSRMYSTSTGSPARRETPAALLAQHLVHAAAHRAKAQNCNFSHTVLRLVSCFCYRLYPQCTPTTMRWRGSVSVSSSGVICMVSVRMVTATSAAPFSGVDWLMVTMLAPAALMPARGLAARRSHPAGWPLR